MVSFSGTAPFVDSSLVRLVLSTAATYPYVTVNAYNAWALFPVDGASMATGAGWIADAPIADATSWASIAGVPAGLVGAALLLLIALVTSVLVARRPDRLTILVGVSVLALAFFAVPTRVHERYLFPLFGLAGILIAFSWRWRIAYAVAGVATFLNMYVVLTTMYPNNPKIQDWLQIGEGIRSWWSVAIIAAMHTAVLAWGIAQLRPGASRALAGELALGALEDEAEDPESAAGPPRRHALPPATPTAPAAADALAATARPRCRELPSPLRPGRPRGPPPGRHRPGSNAPRCPTSVRCAGSGPGWARRRSARTAPGSSTASRAAGWTGWTCGSCW